MRMFPPTPQQSIRRRSSTTTKTIRPVRLLALIALITIGTALAASSSSASSLGRFLFAKATSIVTGGSASLETKATHADHAFEPAFAAESSSMATERRGHTATRLADGRVLIAGGENAGGVLNQVEIYDPSASTFAEAGNMNGARADHTATLLADGRVLIAGGHNSAGALTTTEIFDPATGAFTSGPSMSVARAGHSATLFADGRVFVAGGDASGTAEILNASLSAFIGAGSLNTARSMHSAALLQDGRVLLVGGKDGSTELSSGEIFDTPASAFSTVDNALKVARVRPHLRVLFDGKVQIIGGNNDGSMEIYDPVYEGFGAYAHVLPESDPCTGFSGQIQSSQTRAALFHNGQSDPLFDRSGHTITELGGQALIVGGANSSGAALSSSSVVSSSGAAISTDKMDYAPGETAHISGRGFQPGETVRLKIHEDPHTPQERGFDVVADGDGNFNGEYLVQDYDLNMKFIAGARGLTSGRTAQTTFTDARNLLLTFAGAGSGTVTITPNTGTVNAPVSCGGTGTNAASQTVNTTCLPNITTSDNGATVTFNAVANPGSTFGGWSLAANLSPSTCTGTTNPCSAVLGSNPALTVTFNGGNVNTTTAVANKTATYGDSSVTLTATVTPASGPAINSGSVTFTVKQGPTTIGVATVDTTIVAGAASVNYLLPAGTVAGPYTIEASYTPGAGFNASSGSGSLTINQKGLTITANNKTKTYGDTVTFDQTTPSTDFSVSGLINSDTVASITLTSGGAAATATVAGSPYTIVPSAAVGTGLSNYNISYVNGSLTVDPRGLTITASNKTKVYGDAVTFDQTTPSTDFNVSGLVNSDTVDSITLTSTGAAATATVAGSPYTIVPSATVGTGLSNYNISYVNGSLTVDPRPLTITANNKTKVYGDTVVFDETTPSTDFSVSGLVNSDTVASITLTSTGAAATATVAGSPYTIVPSAAVGTGLSNYNISYVNGSLTVDPRPLTITANNKTKVYGDTVTFDDTTPSTDFSVSGLVNSDTVASITLTSTGVAATAIVAGSPYAIIPSAAVGTGLSNYNISYVNGSLTVDPRPLTITASNRTKVYGDAVTFDETTTSTDFSVSGLVNSDTVASITLTSTGAAATATVAGSPYAIVPSAAVGTGLSNYNISYVNGSLTVDPRPLTITANNKTKVYGDTVTFDETTPSTDFSVSGLVNSDTVASITLTSTGAAATATVAGSPYAIIPSAAVGTGLSNYNISYVNGSLTVDPRPLTITAHDRTKVYGDTVTFDETTPSTDFSVSGLVNSDTVASITLTSTGAAASANVAGSPYAIVPSAAVGTGLSNYNISYVNGSLTVDPRPLTITANNKTKVYGDTVTFDETTPSTDFSVSGLVNSDTVDSVTLTSAGAAATATVAGSPYSIVPSAAVGTGLGNYNISYVNGSLTVDPRPLTITANNKTKVYGDTVSFDDTTPSTDFSVTGLVNSDTVATITLTSTGAAATATVAGSPYAIVPSAAVGTGLSNYNISYVNGSLTVDPRPLTITASNKTKVYGDAVVFDETTPSTDFSVSGLVNSDTVDSVTLTSAGAAATANVAGSPYAIIPSAAVGTGLANYAISYVNGSLTVNARDLTITANNKTKVYGDTVVFDQTTPSTDFSVSGLVNSDTVASITLTSTGAAGTATVAGSPYAIIASAAVGTGLANYNISYVNGSLTVDPRPLTITASNRSKTYGDTVTFDQTTPSTDFSVSGLANSDTVDSITLTSTGAAATANVAGSPYAIIPSAAVGTGLANYAISYVNGSLTVNQRPLTITASNRTKTYGQTVVFDETTPSTDFTVGAMVNSDTVNSITLTSAGAAAGAPVLGSPYSIVPSAAAGTGVANYNITYVNGTLTVNKASLMITASSHTVTFGDAVPTITPSYTGFVAGDDPTDLTTQPICSTTYTVGSLIGTYPTKCENAASSNYNITYVNGTVTVLTACSAFNGFLPPIGGAVEKMTGGSFADPVRSFKLNSTIPVKFSATCFGAPLTTGIHTLQAIKYSNSTTGDAPIDATPTDAATSGNQFRLTDGQWHFNLNTKALNGSGQGIWLLKATLFDGSTYTVWVEIKK